MAQEFRMYATLGVRNDKNRGILIETLESSDGNVYFFNYRDQTLNRHCQQVQIVVKEANIQRARKLCLNMTDYMEQYFRSLDGGLQFEVVFLGTKLRSMYDQANKVHSMRLNKEIGNGKFEKKNRTENKMTIRATYPPINHCYR